MSKDASSPSSPTSQVPFVSAPCFWTGVLGVASGFAVFAYFWYADFADAPRRLVAGMFLAAVMSFVFESLSDRLNSSEPGTGHRRLTIPGLLMTIVLLCTFDIMLNAWQSMPELRKDQVLELGVAITGVKTPPWLSITALLGVWIVSGGALAATLSTCVNLSGRTLSGQMLEGVRRGTFAAVLVAPLLILLYILVVRILLSFNMVVFQPEAFASFLEGWTKGGSSDAHWADGVIRFPFVVLELANNALMGIAWLRPIAILSLLALGLILAVRSENGCLITLAIFTLVMVFLGPVLANIHLVFGVLFLAAMVWVIPGALLGALAPLLARPSDSRKHWGFIAFFAAAFLLLVTLMRLEEQPREIWPLIAGILAILLGGGFVVYRFGFIRECWPVLALSSATLIWCATTITQNLTFSGVLVNLHRINSLPAISVSEAEDLEADPLWYITNPQFLQVDMLQGAGTRLRFDQDTLGLRDSPIGVYDPSALGASPTDVGVRAPLAQEMIALARTEMVRAQGLIRSLDELSDAYQMVRGDSTEIAELKLQAARLFATHDAFCESQRIACRRAKNINILEQESAEAAPDPEIDSFMGLSDALHQLERRLTTRRASLDLMDKLDPLRKNLASTLEELDADASRFRRIRSEPHDQPGLGLNFSTLNSPESDFESLKLSHSAVRSKLEAALTQAEGMHEVLAGNHLNSVRNELNALVETVSVEADLAANNYRNIAASRLELALSACFGFWATTGLLIAWSDLRADVREPDPKTAI